jgi:hypothetical protein
VLWPPSDYEESLQKSRFKVDRSLAFYSVKEIVVTQKLVLVKSQNYFSFKYVSDFVLI